MLFLECNFWTLPFNRMVRRTEVWKNVSARWSRQSRVYGLRTREYQVNLEKVAPFRAGKNFTQKRPTQISWDYVTESYPFHVILSGKAVLALAQWHSYPWRYLVYISEQTNRKTHFKNRVSWPWLTEWWSTTSTTASASPANFPTGRWWSTNVRISFPWVCHWSGSNSSEKQRIERPILRSSNANTTSVFKP